MHDIQYCKEAIKTLERIHVENSEEKKAIDLAKMAIEMMVPKKVKPENEYFGFGRCPNCNAVFMDRSTNNCGNCGQALSWRQF